MITSKINTSMGIFGDIANLDAGFAYQKTAFNDWALTHTLGSNPLEGGYGIDYLDFGKAKLGITTKQLSRCNRVWYRSWYGCFCFTLA
jgi:hypothetical protein